MGYRKFVAAIAVAMAASHAAAQQSLTLTAVGGPLVDAIGTDSGLALFAFVEDDSPQTVVKVDSIAITGLAHSASSDLNVVLLYLPNIFGAPISRATLFDSINDGAAFYANPLAGNYSFTDEATTALQDAVGANSLTAIVPSGTYRPSDFYFGGGTPAFVNLDAAFSGADLSQGSFFLFIQDFAEGNTGIVLGATLNLTVVPEPASVMLLGAPMLLARRRKS